MDLIHSCFLQRQVVLADLIKQLDSLLQIFYAFLDLTVSAKLITDYCNSVFLALREHVILDKLSRSVRHTKCNRAFLHCHHTSRLYITKDHIINRFQICFLRRIYTVHITASSVINRFHSCFYQFFNLCNRIRDALFCQIFILRYLSGMTKETIFSNICICLSNLKCHTDTSVCILPGVLDLQYNLGTEILILSVE